MKGIILAGGSGSRLYPITNGISKQLVPVYDKPLIYYPLSTLMEMGIKDILIISTDKDYDQFVSLLGDGSQFGIRLSYKIQFEPNGIAESFIIAEDFIKSDDVTLILGDNIFFSNTLSKSKRFKNIESNCRIFGYEVNDPERYGVGIFDDDMNLIGIEEKPVLPESDIAITGIYQYSNDVIQYAKELKPSHRGELEITDINNIYIDKKEAECVIMNEGSAWLDAGTIDSLFDSSMFVKSIQDRQGILFGSPEQVALKKKWIDANEFTKNTKNNSTEYSKKLIKQAIKLSPTLKKLTYELRKRNIEDRI